MNTPDTFLHIPATKEIINLAKRCSATQSLGVLTGNNGTGKTRIFKYLEGNSEKCGLSGKVAYFLAASATGPTRGLRDFLADRGIKQAIYQKGLSMKLLAKLAQKELQENDFRLLLIDEADLLDTQALQGFISLADTCRDQGFPTAILFAGVREPSQWIGQIGAAESRTLHYLKFEALTPELVAAVFTSWGAPMIDLTIRAKADDKEAITTLRTIHKGTGGNFRKLYFFAKLASVEHQEAVLNPLLVEQIFSKMTCLS